MKLPPPFLLTLTALLVGFTAQAQTSTPAPSASVTPDATQATAAAYSDINPAKAAEIRKMLELTGTAKMMNKIMDQMMATFRARNSQVSSDFWDQEEKEINTEDLVNKMIPLYDKYYSLEDLKAVNVFYQSPAGQRVLAATPQIMQESVQIGQTWGKGVGMKIATDLQKEKQREAEAAAAAAVPTPTPTPASTTPSTPAKTPASTPSSQ